MFRPQAMPRLGTLLVTVGTVLFLAAARGIRRSAARPDNIPVH